MIYKVAYKDKYRYQRLQILSEKLTWQFLNACLLLYFFQKQTIKTGRNVCDPWKFRLSPKEDVEVS